MRLMTSAPWLVASLIGPAGAGLAPPANAQGGMVPLPSFEPPPRRPPPPPATAPGDAVPLPSFDPPNRRPPPPPATAPGDAVPLPSFDPPTRRPSPSPAPDRGATLPVPPTDGDSAPSAPRAGVPAPPAGETPNDCRPGPPLEPREYTQPEVLGRPLGDRARMCFYRMNGSRAEYLNFFASGHFHVTSIAGSGGFAMGGSVLGATRGTYGFRPGGVLALRTGYQGISVSQTTRGAGTQRTLEASGQASLDRKITLPNCQQISVRDELKRIQMPRGPGHPGYIVVDGVRWEQYGIECPAWQGWIGN